MRFFFELTLLLFEFEPHLLKFHLITPSLIFAFAQQSSCVFSYKPDQYGALLLHALYFFQVKKHGSVRAFNYICK